MFVELKRFLEDHGELESTFFLTMVAKPDSNIAAISLFLSIRSSLMKNNHARVLADVNDLLADLPTDASREDREYLLSLKTECERALSAIPAQK